MVNSSFEILAIKYAEALVDIARLSNEINIYKHDRECFDENIRLLHNYVNSTKSIPKAVKKRLNELIYKIS